MSVPRSSIYSASLGLLVACALSVACSAKGTAGKASDNPVDSFSAVDFTYRPIGNCSDGSLMFKMLSATGFQLWEDPQGPIIVGSLKLYLDPAGTYIADYDETTGDTASGHQRLTGTYKIEGKTLLLSDLGTAESFELNNKFGLALTFSRDIITPGLKDKEFVMRSVLSAVGLQTREEYCAAQGT